MKTKNLFAVILGIAFLALALAPMASASTWFYNASSLTVSQGTQVDLVMVASSHNNIAVSNEKLEAIEGSNSYLVYSWNEPGTLQSGTTTYLWNKNYALDSGALAPGTYTLKFSATTNINVESQILTLVLVINPLDTTAPVITILGNLTENILIGSTYVDAGATAWDNVDENLTSSIITTNNVNTSTPGTYTVDYSVTDNAGNIGTANRTVIVSSSVDTTAPVITITTPSDGQTYASADVTGFEFLVDEANLLDSCEYSIDGANNVSVSSCSTGLNNPNIVSILPSLLPLTLGQHNITVYANDTAGNYGSATVDFTVAFIITATDPVDGDDLDDTEVVLKVTLNEAGYVNYSLDGAANVSMTNTTLLDFESALLDLDDQQYHNVTYYATDFDGHTASLTITFYVDEVVSAQTNSTYDSDSGFTAEFVDTNSTVTGDTISLTPEDNGLNWFQRFINWLCRVFGLEEVY